MAREKENRASQKMGRLVKSRLKSGLNIRRDSYFLVVSFTSLLLYAICLYTFLHLNGYIGSKELAAAEAPASHHHHYQDKARQLPAPYLKSQAHFDDGKIHQFQRNVGQPVDWEMRVKGTVPFIYSFLVLLCHTLTSQYKPNSAISLHRLLVLVIVIVIVVVVVVVVVVVLVVVVVVVVLSPHLFVGNMCSV